MKKIFNYYSFKWTAFFLVVLVICFSVLIYFTLKKNPQDDQSQMTEPEITESNGHFSNEAFGELIQDNLKELEILENITFTGGENNTFTIQATLNNIAHLVEIISELKPYGTFLSNLNGESFILSGHLSENDEGHSMLTADTITFSGSTFSAAVLTSYIAQYSSLNDLVDVPYEEISINQNGVTFKGEIPAIIQTASDSQTAEFFLPQE